MTDIIQAERVNSKGYSRPIKEDKKKLAASVVELRKAGWSYARIADELEVATDFVRYVSKKFNVGGRVGKNTGHPIVSVETIMDFALDRYREPITVDRGCLADAEDGWIVFIGDRPGLVCGTLLAALKSADAVRRNA